MSRPVYRRNVRPPIIKWGNSAGPTSPRSVCELCGVAAPAITLIEQRGIKVSTWHRGCVDNPDVFRGTLPPRQTGL